VIQEGRTEIVGHPVSENTSRTMRELLEKVVSEGGGKNARISGYRIGGKTGTAQVYVDGVVSSETHIGSFVGFAPADDPKIAVLVIVDEADVAVDFGSVTAAPYARDILEKSLNYMGVAPDTGEEPAGNTLVPDVTGMAVADAVRRLEEAGLDSVMDGSGAKVERQLPAAGAVIREGALVMLYVDEKAQITENGLVQVPDVAGRSVLEANKLIRSCGLEMKIEGSGLAVRQSPAAGEYVLPTQVVEVIYEPP
jgi:stage V sporulation protein D (sporulation-specific penicillin-binding protein)